MTRHFEEASLPLVEVIEGCCHVNSSSPVLIVQQVINYPGYRFRFRCKQLMVEIEIPQAKFCETLGLELRSGRAKAAFENPSKVHFSRCVDSC